MEYVPLGHSGIEVSRICIGGMSFGEPDTSNHEWTISPEDTEKVIKHAFEGGINYIDTANERRIHRTSAQESWYSA